MAKFGAMGSIDTPLKTNSRDSCKMTNDTDFHTNIGIVVLVTSVDGIMECA